MRNLLNGLMVHGCQPSCIYRVLPALLPARLLGPFSHQKDLGTREYSTDIDAPPIASEANVLHSVRAYHAGCKIQLQQLLNAFPSATQQGRHHVILQLDQLPASSTAMHTSVTRASDATPGSIAGTNTTSHTTGPLQTQAVQLQGVPQSRLALAFGFGSVVFCPSVPARDAHVLRHIIQPFILDPEPKIHDEDTLVEVRPTFDKWVGRGRDRIIVRTLDLDNLSLIACALGQSAALDHYTEQGNAALEEYYLFKLAQSGSGAKPRKRALAHEELLRMVARNRQLRVEVIGLLGILDKSEAAWRSDKYFLTWQTLSKEFELPQRLEVLLDKMSYLEDEVKYELDTYHSRSLESLVNIVIVLLVFSLLVTLYHLAKRCSVLRHKDEGPNIVVES